jgi:hypothetical protein
MVLWSYSFVQQVDSRKLMKSRAYSSLVKP